MVHAFVHSSSIQSIVFTIPVIFHISKSVLFWPHSVINLGSPNSLYTLSYKTHWLMWYYALANAVKDTG